MKTSTYFFAALVGSTLGIELDSTATTALRSLNEKDDVDLLLLESPTETDLTTLLELAQVSSHSASSTEADAHPTYR